MAPSLAVHGAQQELSVTVYLGHLVFNFVTFQFHLCHILVTLCALPKLDRHLQMSIYMRCLFAFSHSKLHLLKKIFIHQTPGHMAVLFLLRVRGRKEKD